MPNSMLVWRQSCFPFIHLICCCCCYPPPPQLCFCLGVGGLGWKCRKCTLSPRLLSDSWPSPAGWCRTSDSPLAANSCCLAAHQLPFSVPDQCICISLCFFSIGKRGYNTPRPTPPQSSVPSRPSPEHFCGGLVTGQCSSKWVLRLSQAGAGEGRARGVGGAAAVEVRPASALY